MELLERINAILAGLGSRARWLKLPQSQSEYATLKDKRVLMVDDIVGVLEQFVPDLVIATDGKASFLQYVKQPADELVSEMLAGNPDIILLDYNLSGDLKGTEIAGLLIQKGYAGKIVGFSSEGSTVKEFNKVGVSSCIEKNNGYPEQSIKELALLYA